MGLGLQEFARFAESRENEPGGHVEVGKVLAQFCVDRWGEWASQGLERMRQKFLEHGSDSDHFRARACKVAEGILREGR